VVNAGLLNTRCVPFQSSKMPVFWVQIDWLFLVIAEHRMRAISEFKNAGLFGCKLIGCSLVPKGGLPNTGCVPFQSSKMPIFLGAN